MLEHVLLIGPIACGKTSIASFYQRHAKSKIFSVDYAYQTAIGSSFLELEKNYSEQAIGENLFDFYINYLNESDEPLLIDTSPRLYKLEGFWQVAKMMYSIFLYQTPLRCIQNMHYRQQSKHRIEIKDKSLFLQINWIEYLEVLQHADNCDEIIHLSPLLSLNCQLVSNQLAAAY